MLSVRAFGERELRDLFTGLVENAFYSELGMCDPAVVEYVGRILVDFVHTDRIYPFRSVAGVRLDDVVSMIEEAFVAEWPEGPERDREVHRHIGDFTLFWSGLFPEYLGRRRRSWRGQRDLLIDFTGQGKRSYSIACLLSGEGVEPPAELLHRMSQHFDECVYGLGLVRRELRRLRGGHV